MNKKHQIIVDNTAISYLDEGKGPVLIFIHGWLDTKETFSNMVEQLKSEYRCISVDLPNFGDSQYSDSFVSIESYASFLKSFINKLKIKEYVLLGHSMGGQISIFATGNNIIEPSKLVLIASAGVRNERLVLKYLLNTIARLLRKFIPNRIKNKIYNAIGSDYKTDLATVHKKIISNVLKQDVVQDAQKINIPTLLIYGDDDTYTPVTIGQKIQTSIKNSQLEIVKGKNHWLHQTSPEQLNELIRKFVK